MGEWNGVELDGLVIDGDIDGDVEGDAVRLRPLTEQDVPTMTRAMQDRRMHRFLSLPDPYTDASARDFLALCRAGRATGRELQAGIELGGELVGAAGLRLAPGRAASGAELGYSVYPWAQGRGLAARAGRVLFDWAAARGVPRVFVRCAVANVASARTALAAGFAYEGVARADVTTPRGPQDAAVFGRLPQDSGDRIAARLPALPADGLTDGTVALRPTRLDDAPAVFDEMNDPETRRWSLGGPPPTLAGAVGACERAGLEWLVGPNARLAITVAEGDPGTIDRVAGGMVVRQVGPPGTAVIGYGLRPSFRGRGLTARALGLLRGWALDPDGGGLVRLELGARPGNIASLRTAENGGFVAEGRLVDRLRTPEGGQDDELMYAAVRPPV